MKNVINLEALAVACFCLQKVIDQALENPPLVDNHLKATLSLMGDFNSLMSAVKEVHEAGCDKFVVLPVSAAQAEEYTDTDSTTMN